MACNQELETSVFLDQECWLDGFDQIIYLLIDWLDLMKVTCNAVMKQGKNFRSAEWLNRKTKMNPG